jgi:adenine-specific DNA-methyltransferase
MPKKSKYRHLTREQLEAKLEKLERERYGLVWEDKEDSGNLY